MATSSGTSRPAQLRSIGIVTMDAITARRIHTATAAEIHVESVSDASELARGRPDAVVIACEAVDDRVAAAIRLARCVTDAVIVVQRAPSPQGLREAIAAGASGFVAADDLDDTLAPTLDSVLAGQMVLPRDYHRQLERPNLTAREKQILGMVVMGFRNTEIARQLYLAESTVKSHLSAAFAKLGVRSRKDATALILDPRSPLGAGILTIPSSIRVAYDPPGVAPATS